MKFDVFWESENLSWDPASGFLLFQRFEHRANFLESKQFLVRRLSPVSDGVRQNFFIFFEATILAPQVRNGLARFPSPEHHFRARAKKITQMIDILTISYTSSPDSLLSGWPT